MVSINSFRQQFKGHIAEPLLLKRQACVNLVLLQYPKYFPDLAGHASGLLEDDEGYQILCGNTGLILKLEDRYRKVANSTREAELYHGALHRIKSIKDGITALNQTITDYLLEAKDHWINEQGNAEETFSLDQFGWSAIKQASFSKKEKRSKCPQTIINLGKRVIPSKEADLLTNVESLSKLESAYLATVEAKRLQAFLDLRDHYPECQEMYEVTKQANAKLCQTTGTDGGFETDVLEDSAIFTQWYPKLASILESKFLEEGYHRDVVKQYIETLKFHRNVYYVVKHTNVDKTGNNKTIRYSSAEQDLLLYDPKTNRVVATGEVKKNIDDLGHADYQHRRDYVMLMGTPDPVTNSSSEADLFTEYLSDPTISERYISEAGKYATKLFQPEDYQNSPIHFIITKEADSTPGNLHVASKVRTQITNWLFSSNKTPEDYITQKVTTLLDYLHFRDTPSIYQTRPVFVIS